MTVGQRILAQADDLARFSEQPDGITRRYLTPEHRSAGEYLLRLMREAGMSAGFDALGNVVGRYAGETPEAPVLLTGSHLDSVRDAGRYDGLFGILAPIAAVGALHAAGKRLPVAIEVVAFGDEEGVRFGITLTGSKALAGRFDPAWLDARDDTGVTLGQALVEFGGDPQGIAALARDPRRYVGYVEVHIEQGPVLLNEDHALGVVTAIAGGSRIRVRVEGVAGHAGTVPMNARHDALAAAAEMCVAIEARGRAEADRLVATVGRFEVARGGAINVIPGTVDFTIDVRSGTDSVRQAAVRSLAETIAAIARRRGVKAAFDEFYSFPAAVCDLRLKNLLAAAVVHHGERLRELPSGAGHDAMSFQGVLPQAMLFVRCGAGGISHHPDEIMTAADADLATRVLLHFLATFDPARVI